VIVVGAPTSLPIVTIDIAEGRCPLANLRVERGSGESDLGADSGWAGRALVLYDALKSFALFLTPPFPLEHLDWTVLLVYKFDSVRSAD
jgi:hypothetical protein